jgi:hypothetical protein
MKNRVYIGMLTIIMGMLLSGCAGLRSQATTTTTTREYKDVKLPDAAAERAMKNAGLSDEDIAQMGGARGFGLGDVVGTIIETVVSTTGPAPNAYEHYVMVKTAQIKALEKGRGGVTIFDRDGKTKYAHIEFPINLAGVGEIQREPGGWELAGRWLSTALPWLTVGYGLHQMGEVAMAAAGGTYTVGGNMTQSNSTVESSGAGAVSTGGADQSYRPVQTITETVEGSHNALPAE